MSFHDDIHAAAVAAADLAIAPLLGGQRSPDRMQIAQVAVDAARTFLQKAVWSEGCTGRTGRVSDGAAPTEEQ